MALCDTSYRFLDAPRIGFSYAIVHFLTFFVAFFLMISSASAQEALPAENFEDPYLVQNIEADAKASNAVEAREKAFEAAQIAGYEELAKRFLTEEALKSFETPTIDVVERFVEDFEVTNEKLSMTRYKGTYDIRYAEKTFKTPNMDDLYNSNAAAPQKAQLLVIPFLEVNDRHYLWQINPFWDAWKRAQSNKVLGKIIVPTGSRDDVMSIRDGQNLNYDPAAVNAMRIRYNTNQVAIAVASPEPMADNTLNIAIALYSPKPYGPELSQQLSVKAYPGEGTEQLYNRVVATIAQAFHSRWERQTAVPNAYDQNQNNYSNRPVENPDIYGVDVTRAQPSASPSHSALTLTGAKNNIIAQYQFANAREWVETKQAIENINGVDAVQIKSLSSNSATIDIKFNGTVDALRTALAQRNIRLNNAPEGTIFQITK